MGQPCLCGDPQCKKRGGNNDCWIGTASVTAATILFEQLDCIKSESLALPNDYAFRWCDEAAQIISASIEAALEPMGDAPSAPYYRAKADFEESY